MMGKTGFLQTRSIWRIAPTSHEIGAGPVSESGGARFYPVSDRCALLRLHRLCGVELPVAQLDAASSFMPRNYAANMIRASPLACCRDFLLRFAVCQGKNLLAKGRRGALAASSYRGRSAPAAALPRWSSRLCSRGRRLGVIRSSSAGPGAAKSC